VVVVDQSVSRLAQHMTASRRPAGYVLLTVLLLASLIVATTAAYARHTSQDWRQSTASLWVHETREAAQSGVAFARQVLSSGQGLGTSSLSSGGKTISVLVSDAGGDKRDIHVDATAAGLGATLDAEAHVFGLAGTKLPSLTAGAVSAVTADAAAIRYTGTVTVQNQVITGTLKLARSCRLTLKDVVLHGSIVSENALAGAAYNAAFATTLTLQEGVRIEPTAVLPGCAIVLPDGAVVADATSNLEIHGVVIGNSVAVTGTGSMDSQVVATTAFTLPAGIDRPGLGRAPLAWPAALQIPALGLKSLAFHAASPATGEVNAIKAYHFPAFPAH
jgi:hypothetical protein